MQNVFWLSHIINSSKHKKHRGRDNQDSPKINIIYSCRSRWGSWPLKHSTVSSTYIFKNAICPIKNILCGLGCLVLLNSIQVWFLTSVIFTLKASFLGGIVFSEIEKTFWMQCKQCIWELQPGLNYSVI